MKARLRNIFTAKPKRIILVSMLVLLLFGLGACGGGNEDNPTQSGTTATQTTTAEPEPTTQIVEAMIDPDYDAKALFMRLEGVWDNDHEGFLSFIYRDGKPVFYCGAYGSEGSGIGTLIGGRDSVNEALTMLYFQYPASDDNLNGPLPERVTELQIDLTGIEAGELRVRQKTIWYTYDWSTITYRCKTLQEAGIRAIW